MNQFVESLRRLYMDGRVNAQKITELLASNKINQREYDYIISVQREVK